MVRQKYFVGDGGQLPTVSAIYLREDETPVQNGVVDRKDMSGFSYGPDSKLSWVVAAACFLYTFVTIGLAKTNSVIFVEYMKVSGLSRGLASWPFSSASMAIVLVGPLIGVTIREVPPRYICFLGSVLFFGGTLSAFFSFNIVSMIVLFGFIRGVGIAIAVILPPLFINQYFIRHRATAQGIVGAGVSIGVVILLLAVTYGIEKYALRGAVLILSGISMNAVAVSWILNSPPWLPKKKIRGHDLPSPEPTPVHSQKSVERKGVLREVVAILTNKMFFVITLTFSIVINAGLMFNMIIVDYSEDIGIPVDESIYILLAFSTGEFLGKIGLGWVTDKGFLSLQGYFAIAASLSGAIHVGIPYLPNLNSWILSVAFGLCGTFQGSTQSYSALFLDLYLKDKESIQLALPIFLMGAALLALARPPLIGFFRDQMGSYDYLFQLIGLTLFTAAFVWAVERIVFHFRARKMS